MGLDPVVAGTKGGSRQIVWDRISTDLLPLRSADRLRILWMAVGVGLCGLVLRLGPGVL
jgi:hypothetical protein